MPRKKTDHIEMLCDIGELNTLFSESISIQSFLERIVELVAKHMHTEVCSIYLYDEDEQVLNLEATFGLNQQLASTVKLNFGEGLIGKSLKELRPILESHASQNPNFKLIPGLNEELYDAFLAVPILQGLSRIGVLSIQRSSKHPFTPKDLLALKATTNQLANMIGNARILLTRKETRETKTAKEEEVKLPPLIKGKSGSNGFAHGETITLKKIPFSSLFRNLHYDKKYSMKDFDKAIKETETQLEEIQKRVEEKLSDVASLIFTVHLLMLKDTEFIGSMREMIEDGENPPTAVLRISKKYHDIFADSPNTLIREKIQDLEDLVRRLLQNLVAEKTIQQKLQGKIIISKDLLPSELIKLSTENIAGIILVSGGVTSHVSILTRSLQIPLVIADAPDLLELKELTDVILDATVGNIYIHPSDEVIKQYTQLQKTESDLLKHVEILKKPTKTKSGHRVNLMANVNLLSDLKLANQVFSEGIGLYRTEFPFLVRSNFPSEEEQYVIYKKLVDDCPKGKPVTLRTLDIGGDKLLSYFYDSHEQNPAMGMRSIRFSLQHQDVFSHQIRAILRAGVNADLRIMFPMISSLDELIEAKKVVYACMDELKKAKIAFNKTPKIGIMIEIPSIVNILDKVAEEADFFSIGTNDLIQFYLAVDRTNEKLSNYYTPHHPTILKVLSEIIQVGKKHKRDVSICGDIAHDENFLPFLIGVGYRILSVDPIYIPALKQKISQMDLKESEQLAAKVLKQSEITKIAKLLNLTKADNLLS